MIGYRIEVQRTLELHVKACRVLNRLSLGIAISVIGCRQGAELKGIHGIRGVHVEVAEIGVTRAFKRSPHGGSLYRKRVSHRRFMALACALSLRTAKDHCHQRNDQSGT